MAVIDENSGKITEPEIVPYSRVAKGYTYFEEDDVLFAKITPCMQNGKHAIARGLIDRIGFGSTEFHIIRPQKEVLSEWIWFFIRQPEFLQESTTYFTGSVGQQRVPVNFLSEYIIPFPPLPEQRRITAKIQELMKEIDGAKAACEKQLEAANSLRSAYLRSVFESEEAKKWERKKLGDISFIVSKGTTPTTYGHEFVSSGIPFLRAENVNGGPIDYSNVSFYISNSTHNFLCRSKLLPGDLLITIAGTLGRTGYIPDDAPETNCNQAVAFVRLDPSKAYVRYINFILQLSEILSPLIMLRAGGTIQNLSLEQVRTLIIPVPSLPEQRHIVDKIQELMQDIDHAKAACERQLVSINASYTQLLKRALRGNL